MDGQNQNQDQNQNQNNDGDNQQGDNSQNQDQDQNKDQGQNGDQNQDDGQNQDGKDDQAGDDGKGDGDKKDLENQSSDDKKTKNVPEKYDLKLAKDSLLKEDALSALSELSKDMGLSNDQAQKLVEAHEAVLVTYQNALKEAHDKEVDEWGSQIKNDKVVGGDKFEQNATIANKAIEKFGSNEFKDLLQKTGYGNHPELFRFVLAVGRAMGNDNPPRGGSGMTGQRKATAEVLYG